MNNLQNYLLFNSIINGHSFEEYLTVTGLSKETVASEFFKTSVDDMMAVITKMESLPMLPKVSQLTLTFLNFYHLTDYAMAKGNDNSVVTAAYLKQMIREGNEIPPDIRYNILASTIYKISYDSKIYIGDGVLHMPASCEDELDSSIMTAFDYYYNANSILSQANLTRLTRWCNIMSGIPIITPQAVLKIFSICMKKGYHPAIICKCAVDCFDFLPVYQQLGIIAHVDIQRPGGVVIYQELEEQGSKISHIPRMLDYDTFAEMCACR